MQKLDHNIGFQKNANFPAENWPESTKIMIITRPQVRRLNSVLQHRGVQEDVHQAVLRAGDSLGRF
jgi:hypothetical protein